MADYCLTFEITPDEDEIEIHTTRESLLLLKKQIDFLLEKGEDHVHLRTPSWGGKELTEDCQGEGNRIINQVTLYSWE